MTRLSAGDRRAERDGGTGRQGRRAARGEPQVRAAAAAGMIAGYALDSVFGDPQRFHPVAGYGRLAAWLEHKTYGPDRVAGMRHAAIAIGIPVLGAWVATIATRRRPVARALLTTATTWAVLGGASLRREALGMVRSLDDGDLTAARQRLPNLCGRDPSTLDTSELARATVESVAENTSDAVVAPLVWGALAGVPGLVGYRVINTLDAMVGHRNERYSEFGAVAARTDDVANLVPSRLTAALTAAAAPLVDGSSLRAAGIWLRDGTQHPSPNAGQCEAAMAGALGVRLGGRNVYFGRVEHRPILGGGPQPVAEDIRRAARVSAAVGVAALVLCAGHALTRPWSRRRHGRPSRGSPWGRNVRSGERCRQS